MLQWWQTIRAFVRCAVKPSSCMHPPFMLSQQRSFNLRKTRFIGKQCVIYPRHCVHECNCCNVTFKVENLELIQEFLLSRCLETACELEFQKSRHITQIHSFVPLIFSQTLISPTLGTILNKGLIWGERVLICE